MITRDVRDKRNKLRLEWRNLQEKANCSKTFEEAVDLRIREDKVYKKWMFYDKFIKEMEKNEIR